MANLALLVVTYFAIFHVGCCRNGKEKILNMKVSTVGYLKSGTERYENVGMTVHMDKYTNQNQKCVMVMRLEQTTPWKRVDEIMVSCDAGSWVVRNTVLSYGSIVHVKMDHNRVEWVVFDIGDKCFQRTYKDRVTEDLDRMEAALTRVECNRVVQTQRLANKLTKVVQGDANSKSNQEVDTGVLAMNGDVNGYKLVGTNTATRGVVRVEVSFYHKENVKCVRLVDIYIHDLQVQQLKVSCGPSNGRDVNGNFQFGKAFTVRPEPGNDVFNILYHVSDQLCIRRTYTVVRGNAALPSKVTKITQSIDETTNDKECTGLRGGKDVVSPNQWVIYMTSNMRGYRRGGDPKLIGNKGNVQLESQVFYESDGHCVTLGVISLLDMEVQRLKMTCGELEGRRVDQHYQLGSVLVIKALPETGVFQALFNVQNDHCEEQTFKVYRSDPKKIRKSRRTTTNSQECIDLMVGKDLISSTTNKQLPAKS